MTPASQEKTSPSKKERKPGFVVPTALEILPFAALKMLAAIRWSDGDEIGGMLICHKDHPLVVEDVFFPRQTVHASETDFDTIHLADFYDQMDQAGYEHRQYSRVWWHHHPFPSSSPSGTDENTFRDDFGSAPWAVMMISCKSDTLGDTSKWSCRLRVTSDFMPITMQLPVKILWDRCDLIPSFDFSTFPACLAEVVKDAKPKSYTWSSTSSQGNLSAYYGKGTGNNAAHPWWPDWIQDHDTTLPFEEWAKERADQLVHPPSFATSQPVVTPQPAPDAGPRPTRALPLHLHSPLTMGDVTVFGAHATMADLRDGPTICTLWQMYASFNRKDKEKIDKFLRHSNPSIHPCHEWLRLAAIYHTKIVAIPEPTSEVTTLLHSLSKHCVIGPTTTRLIECMDKIR